MKTSRALLALALTAGITLSGCAVPGSPRDDDGPAASETPPASPASEVLDPNTAACDSFGNVARETLAYLQSNRLDEYDVSERYDEVALTATGDVKARILTLVVLLPEPEYNIVYDQEGYNDLLLAVGRACAVGGNLAEFSMFGE